MSLNKKTDLAAEHRRRCVARLLGRGAEARLGVRGIAQKLAAQGQPEELRSVTPDGKPWSPATIARDIAQIKELWQHESLRSVVEHRSKQLATLDELLLTALSNPGAAWAAEARQLVAQQSKLLGTDTDQTRVYELVSQQMHLGVGRLEAHFADRPGLLREIISALVGGEQMVQQAALPQTAEA